jgi:hypothetical protein
LAALLLRRLRELNLDAASAPGRPGYLSAASGLVVTGGELYVVADDELHIGRFPLTGPAPGTLQRVFGGELPAGRKLRKKRKPDLEVLALLPASEWCAYGALLALGSGSRPTRCRGALLPLDAQGHAGAAVEIDAAPLFMALEREFGVLNLEGGWVQGPSLYLLQRGNRGSAVNAIAEFELEALNGALHRERVLQPAPPLRVCEFSLGKREGVPLGFTDGCALDDGGWLFSAVAEDTADAGEDGEFVGAAIGRVDAGHQVQWLRDVDPPFKIEGISAAPIGAALHLLLVADADDPAVPSSLLAATLD